MSMTGLIRVHQLQSGGALNRRLLRELFYQAAQRMTEVKHESLGDNIFDHGHFQESAFEDYYFAYYRNSNFTLRAGGQVPAGAVYSIDNQDEDCEATVAWSLWATANSNGCKMICGWPVVGGKALWGLADLRQAGPVTVYDPLFVGNPDPFTDKIDSALGWVIGDDVAMGGSGVVTLPRGAHIQAGVLLMSVGGSFTVPQASVMVTRRAR